MMKRMILVLLAMLICRDAFSAELFDSLSCGSLAKGTLKGKKISSSSKIRKTAPKALNVKLDLEDSTDAYFLQAWEICGKKILVMASPLAHIVNDMVIVPNEFSKNPIGLPFPKCFKGDQQVNETTSLIPILKSEQKTKEDRVEVVQAWELIPGGSGLWREYPVTGLTCSRH